MNFDSTGMFYFTSPKRIEDVVLVNIENKITRFVFDRKDFFRMSNHFENVD